VTSVTAVQQPARHHALLVQQEAQWACQQFRLEPVGDILIAALDIATASGPARSVQELFVDLTLVGDSLTLVRGIVPQIGPAVPLVGEVRSPRHGGVAFVGPKFSFIQQSRTQGQLAFPLLGREEPVLDIDVPLIGTRLPSRQVALATGRLAPLVRPHGSMVGP